MVRAGGSSQTGSTVYFSTRFYDLGAGVRVQAGSTYQDAVNFIFGHEASDVVGLDAATVDDAKLLRGVSAETLGGF